MQIQEWLFTRRREGGQVLVMAGTLLWGLHLGVRPKGWPIVEMGTREPYERLPARWTIWPGLILIELDSAPMVVADLSAALSKAAERAGDPTRMTRKAISVIISFDLWR